MDYPALIVTLKLAAATTVTLLIVGLPLAHWLATSRSLLRPVVEAIVALPLVLPPTVLGFVLLVAANRVAFSFVGVWLGLVVANLPFAVRPFAAAFAAVDRTFVEASWCLGVSRLATFFRVTLPLALPGVLAGTVLTFAHTVGEFGVVLMLGGNIPGETRTLSLAMFDDVQALDYPAAGRTAAVLVGFGLVASFVVQRLAGRRP